jgi:hypothetical protein
MSDAKKRKELDIRIWVDGWLRDHRAQLSAQGVKWHLESAAVPKGKAVLQLEAPSSMMQVEFWGSGEADVMEMRRGDFSSQHQRFDGQRSLTQILNRCLRAIKNL